MDIKDLKARAYDILAQIDFLQRELQLTNQKIVEAVKKPEVAETVDEKQT